MEKRIALAVASVFLVAVGSTYSQDADLFTLVVTGTPETIQNAIKQGADVNATGEHDWTPLMNAALSGTVPEVLSVLLKAGAKVNARNDEGNSPLMLACGYNGNPDVISILLKAGGDINARDTVGLTPLMFAAGAKAFYEPWGLPFPQSAKAAGIQWPSSADPNDSVATFDQPETAPGGGFDLGPATPTGPPPDFAAPPSPNRSLRAVSLLVKAGSDVNARDKNGMTALMWAAANNSDPQVLVALIKAGATLRGLAAQGITALMIASARNPNPLVITALTKAGEDPKAKDKSGVTVLMYAAELTENPEIIATLLKLGADAKAKDSGGKTAFDYAEDNSNVRGTEVYWKLNDARY